MARDGADIGIFNQTGFAIENAPFHLGMHAQVPEMSPSLDNART